MDNLILLLNHINKKNIVDIDLNLSKASCDKGSIEIINLLETKKVNKKLFPRNTRKN